VAAPKQNLQADLENAKCNLRKAVVIKAGKEA
jgi:hypothetical protein